jgi:tRNA pseudouridine55 synthase
MKGLLLVDKPIGMTSHDVVDRVRKAAGIRRVGHTGTLDPAATGLLIICLGAATRLSEHLIGLDKVYEGAMELGVVTDSHDRDGKVVEERPVPPLRAEDIQSVMDEFTGEILQVPPMVSAVKVGGERLYKRARRGEEVEREARPVTIREFVLTHFETPYVQFRVSCTRGTYVRSLAYDVGMKLGCGATLASLRRTWVGHHSVEHAVALDELTGRDAVEKYLLSIDEALSLPTVVVAAEAVARMSSGAALLGSDLAGTFPQEGSWVQIKNTTGRLLALGQVKAGPAGAYVHPRRVLTS